MLKFHLFALKGHGWISWPQFLGYEPRKIGRPPKDAREQWDRDSMNRIRKLDGFKDGKS